MNIGKLIRAVVKVAKDNPELAAAAVALGKSIFSKAKKEAKKPGA